MKHKLSVQKKPVMKVNGETYRSEIYNYFTKFVKSFDRIGTLKMVQGIVYFLILRCSRKREKE